MVSTVFWATFRSASVQAELQKSVMDESCGRYRRCARLPVHRSSVLENGRTYKGFLSQGKVSQDAYSTSFYSENGSTQEAKGNIGTLSSMNMYSVYSVYKRPQPASHGWGDKDLPNGHLAGDKRGRSNLGVSEDGPRGREARRARAPMRGRARAANFLMGRELFMAWRGGVEKDSKGDKCVSTSSSFHGGY